MNRVDKTSTQDIEMLSDIEIARSGRRNFFKKAAVYSASSVAATSILSPTKLLSEEKKGEGDEAILENPRSTS